MPPIRETQAEELVNMEADEKEKGSPKTNSTWTDEKEYEFHPLSERFPLMEGEEFEDLADDLARNGQKETVKLFGGKILDGRNRYHACKARNIPCCYENWSGNGDPLDYVLSINFHRRHLTLEVRRALAIELRQKGKSIRQIADALHTSYGSVHRDIEAATDPNGSTGGKELPATIRGKDGKVRQARRPKGRQGPRTRPRTANKATPTTEKATPTTANDSAEDRTAKGERPKITDLYGIVHRGLVAAEEAEGLDLKKNAVFFRINGFRVKVVCTLVGGHPHGRKGRVGRKG